LPLTGHASEPSVAQAAFDRLATLVGDWDGRFPDGRAHRVNFRLTAGGTVLLETWALSPTRESLTLYHLDGDVLVATHYCPQGTQPRLQLQEGRDDARLSFRLRDGSSLQVPDRSHQHSFWMELRGADAFARSETYVANGSNTAEVAAAEAEPDAAVSYTRVRTPSASPSS
jgi:hypothetical protein